MRRRYCPLLGRAVQVGGSRLLDEEERAVLDRVVERFRYCNATGIVEAMHRERAYLETEPGEIISCKFAKNIEF